MEDEIFYDLKQVAKILNIAYVQCYKYVTHCKNCDKTRKDCKCKTFEPILQSIDISLKDSEKERARHRVSSKQLEEFIKGRKIK